MGQVSLRRDKGHEAVSVPFFLARKSRKKGTRRIPFPENSLIRQGKRIPKLGQVFLRRDKGHEAVSVPSLYPFLRVNLPSKGHLVSLLPKKYVLGIRTLFNKNKKIAEQKAKTEIKRRQADIKKKKTKYPFYPVYPFYPFYSLFPFYPFYPFFNKKQHFLSKKEISRKKKRPSRKSYSCEAFLKGYLLRVKEGTLTPFEKIRIPWLAHLSLVMSIHNCAFHNSHN